MNLTKLKIGDLKIATYNPRKELNEKDKEYQKIKNSILEFGYVAPIIVNKDMTVISGHQRIKVLKDLSYEEIEEPITKPGDVWILGKHRLMCGDSAQKEDVMRLMNNQDADMLLTDPPYNVDYVGKTSEALKIKNDNMSDNQFYEFLKKVFENMYSVTKEGASIYVFHADTEGLNFRKAFKDAGYKLAECLIWKKDCFVMGRQDYQWQHEPILYGWKEGAAHHFINDRTQSTILEFDRPRQSSLHPTMKPIDLVARLLKNSSKENDKILDLFGGSGSTIIAAEQLNRNCYTMELDPKYCDVIVKRWESLTNKEAILERR